MTGTRSDRGAEAPRLSASYLQGLIQSGALELERLRPAALVGFRPALEVWQELAEDPPYEIYPRWEPGRPLRENLGATANFDLIGAAVLGVSRAALRRAAPGDARLGAAFRVLARWTTDQAAPTALQARTKLKELSPGGVVPKSVPERLLIAALGLPGLVNEFNQARDSRWPEYVKDHPEAAGGTKRDWMRQLEDQAARDALAATCTEARAILSPAAIDLALRNAVVNWSLPKPPAPKARSQRR